MCKCNNHGSCGCKSTQNNNTEGKCCGGCKECTCNKNAEIQKTMILRMFGGDKK